MTTRSQVPGHNGSEPTVGESIYRFEETYRGTRLPVDRALTLNPDAYRSPEYYAVEQEMVFSKGWVCVGYTSQVERPGDVFVATVASQPIFVTRDRSGTVRAFYNVCRHRGSMLVGEDGHHQLIRCPYHSWGYGLDGCLLGAPYFKGLDVSEAERSAFDMVEAGGFRKEDYGLLPVRAETWGCFVFVNLDPEARPLLEWLGDLPERLGRYPLQDLRFVKRKPIKLNANWKLVAENFMEYYHLPWVHPELNTVSSLGNHERYQGPGMYTGMCTTPLASNPDLPIDAGVLPAMPGIDAKDVQSAYWILVAPNIALFLMPHHLFTLLLRPEGPGQTIEFADMLIHPEVLQAPAADVKIDAIFGFWDMVNAQDIAAVERVQRGLAVMAYPGGRMCYRFEESIHRFQNMMIDLMTGHRRIPAGDEPA